MEIREFIAPLVRWWWLILAATVIAAGTSYYSVQQQPEVYQSRATLLVGRTMDDPNPTGTQFTQGQQLAQLYAELAQREPVRRAVREKLGLTEFPEYTAAALPNTQLIEIAVRDTDPARAQAVANALAEELQKLTPSTAEPEEEERYAFVNDQLRKLQQQIEETEQEIEAKQEELGGLFSAQEINQTQDEIGALQAKLSALQSNYATLLATSQEGAANTITVVEAAAIPREPVAPQLFVTVLVASALGFAFASMGAYLLEYLDDSVRSEADVERHTGLPILTTVAPMDFEESASKLVVHDEPRSPHAETYRILGTGIHYAANGRPPQRLLVTSPKLGDGKSVTVANLAIAMAQSGKRVLVIDSDFRRPTQHKLFGVSNRKGFTDLFLPPSDGLYQQPFTSRLSALIVDTNVKDVWLLPSGRDLTETEPSGGREPELVKSILSATQARFDMVIFDSPPCLAFTDPVELSAQVDGVVLVVWSGNTSRSELKRAVERLQMARSELLGVVLNRLSQVDESYYYVSKYYEEEADDEAEGDTAGYKKSFLNRTLERTLNRLADFKG